MALKNNEEKLFIHNQFRDEIKKNHFSSSFGKCLLPGMFTIPLHAIPKPESSDFCLVVDHSAGEFSPNSCIQRNEIEGVKLDGIHALGVSLRDYCKMNPKAELVLWKADILEAYRNCPMHLLWQIKQIVTVKGNKHVD